MSRLCEEISGLPALPQTTAAVYRQLLWVERERAAERSAQTPNILIEKLTNVYGWNYDRCIDDATPAPKTK